jgi:adenylosuccinate lyase
MTAVWEPRGYFEAQCSIWLAQCQARAELEGSPSSDELAAIEVALRLDEGDIAALTVAQGHETNKLLRLVQGRLPAAAGNHLHRGNTSSDVLDTSLSLQILRSLELLDADLAEVDRALTALADRHRHTPQVARTHGQHAVPQTFGRQVAGWLAEVRRGRERIERSRRVMAVGKLSGEVGTHVFISPELETASLERLGLRPDEAPTQVISRDRHAEVLGHVAVVGQTLSRISTNVSLLGISDLGEVREPFDAGAQQGSSAMPHKRNTELSERVRGLSRRVRSAAAEELDAMVLWLERDISHSSTERFTFPDAFGTVAYMARLTTRIIEGLVVDEGAMAANLDATSGAIYGSRLLNALLDTGAISRTDAYERVKSLAQRALDEKVPLIDLAKADPLVTAHLAPDAIDEAFDPSFYLRRTGEAWRRLGLSGSDAPTLRP